MKQLFVKINTFRYSLMLFSQPNNIHLLDLDDHKPTEVDCVHVNGAEAATISGVERKCLHTYIGIHLVKKAPISNCTSNSIY